MSSPAALERPKARDLRPLAQVLRFLAPYRLRIACAVVALVVAAGSVLALGQGLRYVVDAGFGSGDPRLLDRALMALVGIAVVMSIATWLRFFLMMSIGERVITDLRRAVYDHLLALEPAAFESMRTGEVISRLTNDTTLVQVVVGYGFSMFVRNMLMMIGALVMLFFTSAKLAALVVLGVPLTLVPIILLGRRVRKLSRENQDRVADVSAYVDESIHEIRTVQAYSHEPRDRELFGDRAEAAYRSGVSRVFQKAFLISSVSLIAFVAIGVILWIGGHDVLAGRLSAGQLSAFVFYAMIVAAGAGTVSEVWGDLQRAAGATERLMELLGMPPAVARPADAVALPHPAQGRVGFRDVTFTYPARPDTPALAQFTLEIAPGEHVALVGPSGAGKSTVLQLLLRFYDPQGGSVRIDGIDVRTADPLAVRHRLALVPQDPVIFATTVFENVRYGRPDATREAVLAACEGAQAMEFIERLPQGLDTELGERGVRLSGGQRQRLSIARALLADRAILLLDEATSSLDAASEALVQRALERLMRGRTTIVIAHRLATVQGADRIVVMDHGRIMATGTHAELMRQGGLYARLASLQFLEAA